MRIVLTVLSVFCFTLFQGIDAGIFSDIKDAVDEHVVPAAENVVDKGKEVGKNAVNTVGDKGKEVGENMKEKFDETSNVVKNKLDGMTFKKFMEMAANCNGYEFEFVDDSYFKDLVCALTKTPDQIELTFIHSALLYLITPEACDTVYPVFSQLLTIINKREDKLKSFNDAYAKDGGKPFDELVEELRKKLKNKYPDWVCKMSKTIRADNIKKEDVNPGDVLPNVDKLEHESSKWNTETVVLDDILMTFSQNLAGKILEKFEKEHGPLTDIIIFRIKDDSLHKPYTYLSEYAHLGDKRFISVCINNTIENDKESRISLILFLSFYYQKGELDELAKEYSIQYGISLKDALLMKIDADWVRVLVSLIDAIDG